MAYGHNATEKKLAVDEHPLSHPLGFDSYSSSQESFAAALWKKKREAQDRRATAGVPEARMTFGKLDFTALVLNQNLTKKTKVNVYLQNHGNYLMQTWINKNKCRLKEYLEDARELGQARTVAAKERFSDWALLGKNSEQPCPAGSDCCCAVAAEAFFEAIVNVLDQRKLAITIRNVIVAGIRPNEHDSSALVGRSHQHMEKYIAQTAQCTNNSVSLLA